ncbi:MAG: polyisoprenoid-binding protein YceI [Pseudohongiellaceae bacterium]|jgi:polyisoprenoid-binding protein YceI
MRTLINRAVGLSALLLIGLPVQAATWVLDPEESSVIFQYSFGNDPYEGEFTNVEAIFEIDPMSPGACNFEVTINIEDISIDSPEALDYLLDYELFDVDQFPTATFKAEKCSLESMSSFVSEGALTIRDQTHPLTFPFNLDVDASGGKIRFHLTSEVTLNRLEYGVGQGYWASTAEIPNEVTIKVDVYAVQQ